MLRVTPLGNPSQLGRVSSVGSELGGWTKPSLRQKVGAVAVPVMLVLFLLNAPAAVAITSTQDAGVAQPAENHVLIETWTGVILENQPPDNQVVIEVTFDRRLSGDRVGQHKVPPLSPVNMTITVTVSSQVDNATLADYFPNDWTVTDANGGVVSVYDENYNKIEWSVGAVSDSVSRSYVVRSPQRTLPPTKYYFRSELTYSGGSAVSDDWRVIVADPPDTVTLRPNGVGQYWEWTIAGTSPAPTNWESVDDVTPDDDVTYVQSFTANQRDLHALTDSGLSGVTINSVTVYMRLQKIKGGPTACTFIRTHSTDYAGTEISAPLAWTDYSTQYTTNPNTGSAWTVAEVDALEAGVIFGASSTKAGQESAVTQVWVVVDYILAAPGKPVLVSPENNYQTSDNTPTFTWENGANATYHRLVIDNSPDFSDGDNIYDNANIYDNTCTIENELPPDNYWWKVAAGNASGENWSENTWKIEIIPYVPPEWQVIETWTGTVQAPVVWQLIESWIGTVSAPAEWQVIETWTGTVSAPAAWSLIEIWTGTVSATAGWQLVETWAGTVNAPAVWQVVETWTGTVTAPVAWQLIETWSGNVSAPAQWSLIETWTGTVTAPAAWQLIETWTGTVQSPAAWQVIETWTGTVQAPVVWQLIESWIGTVSAPAEWQVIETWTGTVSAPAAWSLIEIWTGTVSATAGWQLVETWAGTVSAPAQWGLIESWTGTVSAPAAWQLVETWTGTVSAPVQWQLIETWTGTVSAPVTWQLIETWIGTVSAPAGWQLIEMWTGTVEAPAEWQVVETWAGTVSAPVAWQVIETWTGTVEAPILWRLIETWTGTVINPEIIPPPPEGALTVTIGTIRAGEIGSADFTQYRMAVTTVRITPKHDVSGVTVYVVLCEPAEVPAITLPVFSCFSITTNIDATEVGRTIIGFQVLRSWIAQMRIDERSIRLLRYSGGWQSLPTSLVGADSVYFYYEVETSGFSLFAVVGERMITPPAPPSPVVVPPSPWPPAPTPPAVPPILYTLLAMFAVGISSLALYRALTWRIKSFVSLKSLKRVVLARPAITPPRLKAPRRIKPAISLKRLKPVSITPAPDLPIGPFKPIPVVTRPPAVEPRRFAPKAMAPSKILERLKRGAAPPKPGISLERLKREVFKKKKRRRS
jgi:PGF-pre-PGF domain-containing protein